MEKKFWNPEIETMPISKLKELQLKRLKKIISYVYENNSFYHKRFRVRLSAT